MRIAQQLARAPWILWAVLAPALVIGAMKLWTGGGQRVPVVGAGIMHVLTAEDAPEGTRLDLAVEAHESIDQTAARIEEAISLYPDILVIGLDAAALVGGEARERDARDALATLTRHVENATGVPVVVGFVAASGDGPEVHAAAERNRDWWRGELCRVEGLRVCVDLEPHRGSPRAIRRALAAGISQGMSRRDQWRASTQVGR